MYLYVKTWTSEVWLLLLVLVFCCEIGSRRGWLGVLRVGARKKKKLKINMTTQNRSYCTRSTDNWDPFHWPSERSQSRTGWMYRKMFFFSQSVAVHIYLIFSFYCDSVPIGYTESAISSWKLLWNCSETALKLLWNCSETVIRLKLLWNCSKTALKLL